MRTDHSHRRRAVKPALEAAAEGEAIERQEQPTQPSSSDPGDGHTVETLKKKLTRWRPRSR
jgi:hypothetical protein